MNVSQDSLITAAASREAACWAIEGCASKLEQLSSLVRTGILCLTVLLPVLML